MAPQLGARINERKRLRRFDALLVGCDTAQAPAVDSLTHYPASQMVATRSSELAWSDLGLVPNVQIAVLSGDPSKPGHYVLRLSFLQTHACLLIGIRKHEVVFVDDADDPRKR